MNCEILKPNFEMEIQQLFVDVFTDSETAEEGNLIGNLVLELQRTTNSNDIFGFIAKDNKKIIGSIFFSRIKSQSEIDIFILSPVAIATQHQKKGVGKKLITFGINHLKKCKVELLLTYGNPNFYSKVGFKKISEDIIKAPLNLSYPEGWLAQSLTEEEIEPISGEISCVKALNNQKYW